MREYESLVHNIHLPCDGQNDWVWPIDDAVLWHLLPVEWLAMKGIINKYCPGTVKSDEHPTIAIQAGGCLGMYPRMMAGLFHTVYTFEPHPVNFHCLSMNCQLPNIIKTQGALGKETGQDLLYETTIDNMGQHYVDGSSREVPERRTGTAYPVQTHTIDSLNLPACTFIQLDVEGYEEEVLLGSINTIDEFEPVIVLEFPDESTTRLLKTLGYVLAEVVLADSVFVKK